MFLVAGLAVAGLVGIAAAFYFSIRSGSRRDKRLRSAAAGRAGTGRRPATRAGTARPDLASPPRRAADGAAPVTTFRPAAVSSRNPRAADLVGAGRPGDRQPPPEDPWSADAEAEDSWSDDSWPGGEARTAKARRRVGFRKGSDLDEELWPAETFGGVSDEQFWDDLASDKPLATTARTAQQDSPGKNRLPVGAPVAGPDPGPATDPQAVKAQADDRKRDGRAAGRGRPGSGSGGYAAAPRTGPDPAAERTAIQPAYAATQPVQNMKPPLGGATQPARVAANGSQPMSTAAAPRGAATQPAETRRRRPSSTEEDPLTSAAFAQRPSGPVDGRSSLRARDTSSSTTQAVATPPYGQDYGHGRADAAAQVAEPERSRTGTHARPNGSSDWTRTARPTQPRHSYQATGGYLGNGSYPGNGNPASSYPTGSYPTGSYPTGSYPAGSYPADGYPGNGHRGNGHRASYDPRDDYRRLTHPQ